MMSDKEERVLTIQDYTTDSPKIHHGDVPSRTMCYCKVFEYFGFLLSQITISFIVIYLSYLCVSDSFKKTALHAWLSTFGVSTINL